MGLHDGHRQRKRQQFLSHGPESMADHELLELALFYAIPRRDTNETAHRLLDQFGSLDRVLSAPEQELEKVEGVGQGAAVLLRLMGSIGDRARRPGREEKIVASVDQAGAYFLRLLDGQRTEQLYQLCVDAKGKVLAQNLQSSDRHGSQPGRAGTPGNNIKTGFVAMMNNLIEGFAAGNHAAQVVLNH